MLIRFALLLILSVPFFCTAQQAYKTGDVIPDLPIKKILNHTSPSAPLNRFKNTLIIIDFFGTWCVPCIRALPELASYKSKFSDNISIVLVSTEEEAKLSKFISNRQPFPFPLIVDEDKAFTNLFQPPSYPYTIILNKDLKVLSIRNAADLSESMLEKYIAGEQTSISMQQNPQPVVEPVKMEIKMDSPGKIEILNPLIKLSQDYMYAARLKEDAGTYITQLEKIPYSQLQKDLSTDDEKKAFWINIYNASVNVSLQKNPEQYKKRRAFFKSKSIIIAGKQFSLDDIEHGILRRSKIKWSLGYLNKIFPSGTEKELRVDRLDYRIHFALNCGAKSCPPIAFYNSAGIYQQLDLATNAFLSGEAVFDKETNTLQLPAILSWFRRDFGGKKKMLGLVKQLKIMEADASPKITFKKYDWGLYLENYKP